MTSMRDESLQSSVEAVPKHDVLLVIGDLNEELVTTTQEGKESWLYTALAE